MVAFLTSWPLTDGIVQAWRDWCHVSVDPADRDPAEPSAKSVSDNRDDADLMLRRMAVLDLDAKKVELLHPILFPGMKLACAGCASRERCEQDLDYELEDRAWEAYCPNAETFRMFDVLPWYAARSRESQPGVALAQTAPREYFRARHCGRSP